MTLKRDLEFLYEIGCLRFVRRTWEQFMGPSVQNLSEHTLRVAFIAMIIAKHEGVADLGKVVKMAIIHDLTESRTGDVHYVSREFCKRDEHKAADEMFSGTILEEFKELWKEYEKRECIEAKIVKDADNLDVDFELHEQSVRGHGIKSDFEPHRRHVYSHKLTTATAKKIWEEIQTSNPHDWHLHATNRFTAGDWKKDSNP